MLRAAPWHGAKVRRCEGAGCDGASEGAKVRGCDGASEGARVRGCDGASEGARVRRGALNVCAGNVVVAPLHRMSSVRERSAT